MELKTRVLEGELMDAPDLDAVVHQHALRGLNRVNWLSGTATRLYRFLLPVFDSRPDHTWRVLDLASGGGDVTLQLAQRMAAADVNVYIEGWDRSPTAIEHANENLRQFTSQKRLPANTVQFLQRDLFDPATDHLAQSAGSFDVIMCTLFLHHLNESEARSLLARAFAATGSLVLVDDLRRTWLGYRLAQLGCQVLTRSKIVHVDGPLSVRAAFTVDELKELSRQASLPDPILKLHWPQRFLACWRRSPHE